MDSQRRRLRRIDMVFCRFGNMIHQTAVPEQSCMKGFVMESIGATSNTVTGRLLRDMEHTRRGFERYDLGDPVRGGVSRRA